MGFEDDLKARRAGIEVESAALRARLAQLEGLLSSFHDLIRFYLMPDRCRGRSPQSSWWLASVVPTLAPWMMGRAVVTRERTFEIDRIFRDGAECLIEGVKYVGDPHRRCRLTLVADGCSYKVEGFLTPMHAAELAALLPRPHAGIDGMRAGVVGYGGRDWRLTVENCPPGSCLTVGITYPADGFGLAEPVASEPGEEEPEPVAPRFRH